MWWLWAACLPDDWNGEPYTGPPGTGDTGDLTSEPGVGLAGSWLSEGEDLSPLFSGAPFEYERVEGSFSSSGTYTFSTTLASGEQIPVSGTFSADTSTEPASITLEQEEPYEASAQGIFSVDGDVLTYEVVQTEPDYGYSPPTPSSGFGSTSGPAIGPGDNVQTFRRIP
jgi:hypothetical protein